MERNMIEKQDLEKLLSTTRGQIDTLNHLLTEQERELYSLQRQLGTAIMDRDHFGSEAQVPTSFLFFNTCIVIRGMRKKLEIWDPI